MATLLLLARHAAHEEVGRLLSGRTDGAGLSEEGRAQARRLAQRVRREAPAMLRTSPRRRARETAALLGDALRLTPQSEPALDEIDFGAWTGRAFAELEGDPHWRTWNEQREIARPPEGEAMSETRERMQRWTVSLQEMQVDGPVLAVSHADVIKALLCAHLGLPLDAHWRFEIAPASLSAIELWPGGGRVRFINDVSASEGAA